MLNIIRHRPDLAHVVMPLVRVQKIADLSWADRAELSSAIASCVRHWNDMEAERQHIEQQTCGQQSSTQTIKSETP
jgi:hypothetical protein